MERKMTAMEIADVNDYIRHNLFENPIETNGVMGRVVTTPSIMRMGVLRSTELFTAVANFCAFAPDNDPSGEHDFGSVEMFGETFFWKLDCYDESLTYYGHHTHVLTIMNSREY